MPKKQQRGLGRGLDVLLPDTDLTGSTGQEIPIGDIDPNPEQPRQIFAEEEIAALAQSIANQGVLQPLLVVPTGDDRYRIVAGERRWRAARKAGLTTVPCIIRDLDETEQMEIALVENLQREDLNPVETAAGIKALMKRCGYTQAAAADRLGMSRPNVANLLRLLTLPEDLVLLVRENKLSAGHARVLVTVDSDTDKRKLAAAAVEKGWNVRQMEEAAAQLKQGVQPRPERIVKQLPAELSALENRIRETMGVRAELKGSMKRGRIVLQYYSRDELEQLYEAIERLGSMSADV